MCFKDVELSFQNNNDKFILVTGLNNDSQVASSNGSGKSTLYDAIFWCLWGNTRRGIKGAKVISKVHNSKKASVAIYSKEFKVERVITTKGRSTATQFHLWANQEGKLVNVTQASVVGTTKVLTEMLNGIDANTFGKLTYFGQNDSMPITQYGDSDIKSLLTQAMGVEFLPIYQKRVKEAVRPIQEKIDEYHNSISKVRSKLEYIVKLMQEYKQQINDDQYKLDTKKQDLQDEIIAIGGLVDEANEIEIPSMQEIQEARVARDNLLGIIKEFKSKDIELIRMQYNAHLEESGILKSNMSNAQQKLNKSMASLKTLETLVGTKCRECGKEYLSKDLDARKDILIISIKELNEKVKLFSKKVAVNKRDMVHSNNEVNRKQKKIETLEQEIVRYTQVIYNGEKGASIKHNKITRLHDKLQAKKDVMSNLASSVPKLREMVETAQSDAKELRAEQRKYELIIKKLKETKPSIEGIKDVNIKKIFNYYNMHIEQYNNLKYYLIAKLLYDTGVRLNELINVKIANIDIPLRCIYLANSKTGEPRFVFFKESTRTLLNSYLNKEDEDTPYLFPSLDGTGHIRGESIYRAFRRLQERLEIKQSISPHKFRHTFAQLYLLNGGNTATLQKYLGHSELSTTEMYLRFNKEYLKEMYDKTMIDVRGEADGRK